MNSQRFSKRFVGFVGVLAALVLGGYLVKGGGFWGICIGVVLIVLAILATYLLLYLRKSNEQDVLGMINKDFPTEQREQVVAFLNRYSGESKEAVHDLILSNAKGNIAKVDQLSKIAGETQGDFRDVIAAVSNAVQENKI